MKRLLIASEDPHTLAWVQSGARAVDAAIEVTGLSGLRRGLMGGECDLVIIDASHDTQALFQLMEDAGATGVEIRMLAIIEAGSLSSVRLPVRVISDFIVRGASPEELTARVRNLLWPGEDLSKDELIRIDNLTLNLATYQAYIDGEPVDFTYLEYALFAFLVTHPGRTHTREALLRRVWGTEYFGGSRTVDVHVRRIRSKIGGELSRHLETVRNVGYLWSA